MSWGVPRRPKISTKLGNPNPREGSDGDIQVRQTGVGARLFAKLGGRWLSSRLYGNDELDNQDVFIPKVWLYRGKTASSTSGVLQLPNFINYGNLISISYMHNFGGDELWFWSWDTDEGAVANSVNEIGIRYDPSDNTIEWDMGSAGSPSGAQVQDKNYKIAVFFK